MPARVAGKAPRCRTLPQSCVLTSVVSRVAAEGDVPPSARSLLQSVSARAAAPPTPPRCGTRARAEGLHISHADFAGQPEHAVTVGHCWVSRRRQLCQTYSCVRALVLLCPVRQVPRLLQTVLVGWQGHWGALFLFFV